MQSGRIREEQIERFQQQGFLNAGKILDEVTVDGLSAELDRPSRLS